jgi:hypothetical protein
MTTTDTNMNTTTRPAPHTYRLRRIAIAAALTGAFAGTAALATNVLRDETQHHSPAVVVPGPYNGLPNLNDLGVTVPTVSAGTGH